MGDRFHTIAAIAANQHSVVSTTQLQAHGVSAPQRCRWVAGGLLVPLGFRSWAIGGSSPTWLRSLKAAEFNLNGGGYLAGRTACRLHGLDGFGTDAVEALVGRARRGIAIDGRIASMSESIPSNASVVREGIRCLTVEHTILTSPLFGFTSRETENAIDSAIRLRLVSEKRLRALIGDRHTRGINGSRQLLDALIDTGSESHLERTVLRLLRTAGLPRPDLRRTFRSNGRTVARVDLYFSCGLVVELNGHATHSSRRSRQLSAQRRTELTLQGERVIDFTYEDVHDRPTWVLDRIRDALHLAA